MLRIALCALLVVCSTLASTAQAWQRVSTLTTTKNASLVARNGGLLLYDNDVVFHSVDNGKSWVDLSQTFQDGISASCTLYGNILIFFPSGKPGEFIHSSSADGGANWNEVSRFHLSQGEEIIGVELFETQMYAFTSSGSIMASWDGGLSWHKRTVGGSVGGMVDLAVVSGLWLACGTDGSAWSDDDGITWTTCAVPVEIGSGVYQVENSQGKIWGGGLVGIAEFDPITRSWNVRNNGVPTWAGLQAKPVALLSRDNVLFAVFQTFDGYSTVHRWAPAAGKWVIVNSDGIPRFNHAGSHQFACSGNRLFLYVHADDVNFVGVYNATHDAPTEVGEDVVDAVASIDVMPQPASTTMTVRTASTGSMTMELVDMQGRVVHSMEAWGEATIDVNGLAPGMYLLRLLGASSFTQRLVVVER